MCFAPQQRALFSTLNRHPIVKKLVNPGVFCMFSLQNVLRAPTAYTFSISQLPEVVQSWRVFYVLTSKCASSHNSVHFFDTHWPSNRPKAVWTSGALTLFTSKCALRHNGVHFFNIWTSKGAPRPPCVLSFYFQMCFAPQRRALFHLSSGQNKVFHDFPTFRAPASSLFWLSPSLIFPISYLLPSAFLHG